MLKTFYSSLTLKSFLISNNAMHKKPLENCHVLLVDEDNIYCQTVATYLSNKGLLVHSASNLHAAKDIASKCLINVILLDSLLPDGTGIEFLQFLSEKNISAPVLIITSDENQISMQQYFSLGISAYLHKSVKMELLWLVLHRSYTAYQNEQELQLQNKRLELLLHEQQQEEDLARHVYRHLSQTSSEKNPAIRTHMQSSKSFNGDFFISEQYPNGNSLMMLMDGTGHGLASAISILPVVTTTRAMLQKGIPLPQIMHEINLKLFAKIPEDRFVAIIGIEIDHQRKEINIINAGMPDVLLIDDAGEILHTICSRSLPLGIVDKNDFSPQIDSFPLAGGQHMFFYSDGLTEQRSSQYQAFGKKGLHAVFARCSKALMIFDEVVASFEKHCADTLIEDDASVCYVDLQSLHKSHHTNISDHYRKQNGHLHFNLDVAGNLLSTTNLLTTVDDVLRRMNLSAKLRQKAFTVISELVNNALDHGVLQLESSLKQDIEGFTHYLEERVTRLLNLNQQDRIKLSLNFEPEQEQLNFTITDSGQGYQYDLLRNIGEEALFGRGLKLVKQLCKQMSVFAPGNRTTVIIK